MSEQSIIEVKDLVQKAGRQVVLNGISFTAAKGECLGVFGLSGTGKTSLLHILAGVDRFTSGTVEVLGCNVRKQQDFKKHMGLVTQERSLFQDLNAGENLDFMASIKGVDPRDIDRVVTQVELKEYLHQPVSKMDLGVYQRLALACALLGKPQLLIADELISNFDIYSSHIIVREIRQFMADGGTVILGFSIIELCDLMTRVAWLDKEQINIFTPPAARQHWDSLVQAISQTSGDNDV
ncbi:MAG: ABC transporter ATP-binding protein [Syntrophomonas sp.]